MRLNHTVTILLVLMCCFFKPQVFASQAPVALVAGKDYISLKGHVRYLEDTQKNLSANALLEASINGKFTPFNLANDSIGVTNSVWWFHFQLDFSNTPNETHLLLLNNPLIYDARLYQQIDNQLIELNRGGFAYPANKRAIFDAELIFPLKKQQGLSSYYLRVSNNGALQLPLSIWKPEALAGKRNINHLIMGLYYGLIISMAVYNLFVGWSTKVNAYYYYVGYLLALAMTMAFNDGYAQILFFQESPYIAYLGINWASAFVLIFASQFARDFLNTKANTPLIDKWLLANIIISGVYLVVNFSIDSAISATIIIVLIMIFMLSMFTVGIACWIRNVRAAPYFVFSWVFMVLGTFMVALTKLGAFPAVSIGEFGTHIGSAIEAMLLSFALAARIKWLEDQKVNAEKEARNALEISHKKLQESGRVKDEFFSLLSHELRTPMNGIRGIIDLFKQDNLTNKQAENLKVLSESTDEMLSHVDQLLVFSQLKSDHLKLNQRPFNLAKLLERLETHCQLISQEKKIDFKLNCETLMSSQLIGDERVLFVILNQLIQEHINYKGLTRLSLTVSQKPCSSEKYNTQLTFEFLSFLSKNENKEISPEQTSIQSTRLAANYIQPDSIDNNDTTSNVESILKHKLVNLLHGSLTHQKIDDFTFETELVLSFKQAIISQTSQLDITKDTKKRRGLVVDDNSVNRIVASKYLEQLGYDADTASDGEEALLALSSCAYDFILMDCHMPVLNGFKTTLLIRQGQTCPQIPIIAVTADVTVESTQECLNSGMNEVLHKPLRLALLSETLNAQGLYPKF